LAIKFPKNNKKSATRFWRIILQEATKKASQDAFQRASLVFVCLNWIVKTYLFNHNNVTPFQVVISLTLKSFLSRNIFVLFLTS